MKILSFYRTAFLLLLVALVAWSPEVFGGARSGKKKAASLPKTAVTEHVYIDGNRINDIAINNGQFVSHTVTGNSGMEWPKGTFNTIDYAAGIWLAGKARSDGSIRTAAAEYAVENQPGVILASGQPDDPTLPNYKWYKINRSDLVNPSDDYLNWPAADGAPVDALGKPALVGDQMLWCVFNDANSANHGNVFGTPAMGIETQLTIWVYNRPDAFGDMMFVKAKLIHKGTETFDSSFVALWDDPDNGDAADDYVGCDTTLSLGYCYNGDNNDSYYGDACPVIGRDFFQGPIVPSPGDTANVSGKKVPGYKNLPMYAFAQYTNAAPYPEQDPESGEEAFNYMTGHYQDGSPFVNPITNQPTRFIYSGDPGTGTGWTELAPTVVSPGDRRLLMSCGPFTFAPGDTQEVVFGVIIARGSTNLNSVTVLKQNDAVAQLAYDLNFALPPSPPAVTVSVAELDGEIVLTWDDAAESYSEVDLIDRDLNGDPTTYNFEGYCVYQLDAESGAETTKRLAVSDIADNNVKEIRDIVFSTAVGEQIEVTVVKGTDEGVEHMYRTKLDGITGLPLVNGRPYYFAVTAYGYNEYGIPKMYEGPLAVLTAVPKKPLIGTRLQSAFGDTILATHTGPSDGSVLALVVDPSSVTGDSYNVTFADDGAGGFTWDLVNTTTSTVVLNDQAHQSLDGDNEYLVADGIQVKVIGPQPGMKTWSIPTGTRRFSWAGGFTGLGLEGFSTSVPADAYDRDNGTIGMAGHFAFGGIGTTLGPADYKTVLLKLAAVDTGAMWNPLVAPTDANFSKAYRVLRSVGTTSTPARPEFGPWIINKGSGYPYQDYNYGVPFSAWDMSTTPPTRLAVGMFENNVAGGMIDGRYWPPSADGLYLDGDNVTAREFVWIFDSPYTDTPDASLAVNLFSNASTPMMWVMVCNRRAHISWPGGDEFLITAYAVNSTADVFSLSTAGLDPEATTELAKADVDLINVAPNPYFGSNPLERNAQNRFVTITRLPDQTKTTIRIFTLSGVLVRVIEHAAGSTYEQWDLRNQEGIPVASGMYLIHVDIEGLGSKILKLGVIQPEERLDRL